MNPRVYVLARSVFDPGAMLAFLRDEGTGWRRTEGASGFEELVEVAGRVCYMSFGPDQSPRSNEDYIRNLIKMGHESVLEHASWTVLIADVSRAFTHQLVRHRPGFSFSQLSQQYHDERDAKFIEPTCLTSNPKCAGGLAQRCRGCGAQRTGALSRPLTASRMRRIYQPRQDRRNSGGRSALRHEVSCPMQPRPRSS